MLRARTHTHAHTRTHTHTQMCSSVLKKASAAAEQKESVGARWTDTEKQEKQRVSKWPTEKKQMKMQKLGN